MSEHDLKCWPEYYAEVDAGRKTFEIRKDDRGFRVGDVLLLREYEPQSKTYTGRSCRRVVTYVTNFGQPSGYVVMAIKACEPAEPVAEDGRRHGHSKLVFDKETRSIVAVDAHPPRSSAVSEELDLIRAVLNGYPSSIARNDALCAVDVIRTALHESGEQEARDAFYEGAKAGAQAFSDMLCGLSNKPPHDVGTDRNALDHIVSRMHDKYGSPAGQVELAARAAIAQERK